MNEHAVPFWQQKSTYAGLGAAILLIGNTVQSWDSLSTGGILNLLIAAGLAFFNVRMQEYKPK
jgi:hypothetical protein